MSLRQDLQSVFSCLRYLTHRSQKGNVVGPYNERAHLAVVCEAEGGQYIPLFVLLFPSDTETSFLLNLFVFDSFWAAFSLPLSIISSGRVPTMTDISFDIFSSRTSRPLHVLSEQSLREDFDSLFVREEECEREEEYTLHFRSSDSESMEEEMWSIIE